jgi:cell division protein FtsW
MSPTHPQAGTVTVAALDWTLVWTACALLTLGWVALGSASFAIAAERYQDPFHFVLRQGLHLLAGAAVLVLVSRLPTRLSQRAGPWLVLGATGLLALLFVPGLGQEANGSVRWLRLGPLNVQAAELAKLALVIYLAGYLIRRAGEVRTLPWGFLRPLLLAALIGALLVLQPDFGAAAVVMATAMGMMFIGGVRLLPFVALMGVVSAALAALIVIEPYRLRRFTSFVDPWADPFDSGFQLTQSLIAFGRGEVFGTGLGEGVQKLFYLPEAHTDFLFAVIAEELGLMGSLGVIVLFVLLIARIVAIAARAEGKGNGFGAYLTYGVALWFGLQAFINLGVNMGLLPTKGITLPLMSYGGSSLLVSCLALGLVLRVDRESRDPRLAPRAAAPSVADAPPVYYTA